MSRNKKKISEGIASPLNHLFRNVEKGGGTEKHPGEVWREKSPEIEEVSRKGSTKKRREAPSGVWLKEGKGGGKRGGRVQTT